MEKALQKKNPEVKVKKEKPGGANAKKVGSGGRVRYSYPHEKKPAAKPAGKAGEAPKKQAIVVPVAPGPLPVDGKRFAQQLGVRHEKVVEIAHRFKDDPRKRGADGFAAFMWHNLHEFNAKHALEQHYYRRLYAHLTGIK